MPMLFPTSPTVGQVFTSGGRSWVWSGATWDSPTATNTLLAPYGLTHINTTDYSAVTSVSFPDNVFTSEFQNYRILVRAENSGSTSLNFRFRTGGVDNSTANYTHQSLTVNGASVAGALSSNQTAFSPTSPGTSATNFFTMDIYRPKESTTTTFRSFGLLGVSILRDNAGSFTLTTSFDSMSLSTSSGTITGKLQLFGYRN